MNIHHLGKGGLSMSTGPTAQAMLSCARVSLNPLCSSSSGSAEDGPRVVFMVDLWHPNVAAAERQALDFIFAPGR